MDNRLSTHQKHRPPLPGDCLCGRHSPCVYHYACHLCVRLCPPMSAYVRLCPSVSVCVGLGPPGPSMSACVRLCPSMSVCVRLCPSVTVCVRMCPFVSVCLSLYFVYVLSCKIEQNNESGNLRSADVLIHSFITRWSPSPFLLSFSCPSSSSFLVLLLDLLDLCPISPVAPHLRPHLALILPSLCLLLIFLRSMSPVSIWSLSLSFSVIL